VTLLKTTGTVRVDRSTGAIVCVRDLGTVRWGLATPLELRPAIGNRWSHGTFGSVADVNVAEAIPHIPTPRDVYVLGVGRRSDSEDCGSDGWDNELTHFMSPFF
jgi:hypothetical protein